MGEGAQLITHVPRTELSALIQYLCPKSGRFVKSNHDVTRFYYLFKILCIFLPYCGMLRFDKKKNDHHGIETVMK